jgi:hypothetical protein
MGKVSKYLIYMATVTNAVCSFIKLPVVACNILCYSVTAKLLCQFLLFYFKMCMVWQVVFSNYILCYSFEVVASNPNE